MAEIDTSVLPGVNVPLIGVTDLASPDLDNVLKYVPFTATDEGRLLVAFDSPNTGNINMPYVNTLSTTLTGGMLAMATAGVVYLSDNTLPVRYQANSEDTLLGLSARTASVNSADQTNYNYKGCHIIINVTSVTATPSVVPTIQGVEFENGDYYDLLVGSAITATGITVLKIYPGIGQIAGGATSDILPRTWRVSMTHADADSITYSVSYALVI